MMSWRDHLWLALLVGASIGFSAVFACATPFAAFSAATALTLARRDALRLTGALWLANQIVGYAVLDYPWTANSVAWGAILGAATLLGTLAATWIARRLGDSHAVVASAAACVGAFVVYESVLGVAAIAWLGGTGAFAPMIVLRIFALNVLAFGGFLGLHRLGMVVGLAPRSAVAFSAAR